MKNAQQKLLVILALGLCGLCAFQWYTQTVQRARIQTLNQLVYDKSVAIRDDTNSIATLNHQVEQMDARLTELKDTLRTNSQVILSQRRELARIETLNAGLTNGIAQYQKAVDGLTAKLKEAYAGIRKQDESIKELAAQRDQFVEKYNASVKDRNEVVAKYNDLAARVEKMQADSSK
jgi:chromosome segregation ATPase